MTATVKGKRKRAERAAERRLAEKPACTVVALDPGVTTGWCVMSVHPAVVWVAGVPLVGNIKHWASGQIAHGAGSENETVAEALELIEAWPGSAVVCEDFILRTATKDRVALSPVRITAALSFALSLGAARDSRGRSVRKMHLQQPSLAMTTATDDRLKRWGLYVAGEPHARDATRHAVTFIRRAGERRSLAAEAWPSLFGAGADEAERVVARAGKWS